MLAFDLICGRVGFSVGRKHLSCGLKKLNWNKNKSWCIFSSIKTFFFLFWILLRIKYNKIINIYKLKMCGFSVFSGGGMIWRFLYVCGCVRDKDPVCVGKSSQKLYKCKSSWSLIKVEALKSFIWLKALKVSNCKSS